MEQWYSDAYFPRRQKHVIRRDVRFKLKDWRSNNSYSDVNNARERNSVFKKCVTTIYGHVWIFHSMAYVLVLQWMLSVLERSDA